MSGGRTFKGHKSEGLLYHKLVNQNKSVINTPLFCTVEPVLEKHPIAHKNMVSQDRWSLVTGSFTLKM